MNVVSLLITLALVAPGQLGAVKTSATDAAITTRIETMYLLNEHLSLFEINTNTQDGVVTLLGGVETQIQKDLAGDLAGSLEGVSLVNNYLTVVPDVKKIGPRRTFRINVEDKTITASVRIRLLNSDHLRGLKIDAKTNHSVVTLTGLVRTEFQREKVEHITYNTRGVDRVINHLTITLREEGGAIGTLSDELLEKRLETSFLLNRNVHNVDIEVDDGVVYLTGTVNSAPERELAGIIAVTTRGVKHVENKLNVQGELESTNPSLNNMLQPLEPLEDIPETESLVPLNPAPQEPVNPPSVLEGDAPLFPVGNSVSSVDL